MIRDVFLAPAARAEMLDAVDWYNARAPGLGGRLVGEIDATVARILSDPAQFPVVWKDLRRARLRRFPYGLFFRLEDTRIEVLACFHSNRDPRRWQQRT